jgi:hypothetical protein
MNRIARQLECSLRLNVLALLRYTQLIFLVSLYLVSCGPTARGGWKSSRTRIGDTIVVRTIAGSFWSASPDLLEEMRLGQDSFHPRGQAFSSVRSLAVGRDKTVLLEAEAQHQLLLFDSTGAHRKIIGARGADEGELGEAIAGVGIGADGKLIVRDAENWRLNIYNPDGSFLTSWPIGSDLQSSEALILDTLDNVYLTVFLSGPDQPAPPTLGLLQLDSEGRFLDSLPIPRASRERATRRAPFRPGKIWGFSPFQYFVVGWNDRYEFDIVPMNGPTIRVQRETDPIPLGGNERSEWAEYVSWLKQRLPAEIADSFPSVPQTKPYYKAIRLGDDGRIWILRHTKASRMDPIQAPLSSDGSPPLTWQEPEVWDVFDKDGVYWGEIRAPSGTTLRVFSRDLVWGIERNGNAYHVVRYRIITRDDKK